MFRVSAIACSSATDFLFSSAISTWALLRCSTTGETPRWGCERSEKGIWEFEGVRRCHTRVRRTPSQEHAVSLSEFLLVWGTTSLPDREVIDGLVHPLHAGPSAALAAALAHWPGSYYWSTEPDGRHLVLTRAFAQRRVRWGLHVLLLVATLFTTTFVGAVFNGALPLDPNPLALLLGTYALPTHFVRAWATGLTFSLPLVAVLLCHELGHYLTARHYQLDVSPPYFIPFPFLPWSIGTIGAFIRLRTIVSDRRQLLDVGIAGPLAGLVIALPALWIGLRLSNPLPGFDKTRIFMGIALDNLPLGDSLVTLALRRPVHRGAPAILLHPLPISGCFGMFV